MRVPFTKMHGLGNDFVVFDAREAVLPPLTRSVATALADRRTGIGCDQIVLIEASVIADWKMRIINADGSEVEACGNAARAVGLLLKAAATLETLGGVISIRPDGEANEIAVNMGTPSFDWCAIPLAYAMDTLAMPVAWDSLDRPVAVNVGNPHLVFFVADAEAVPLHELGPQIENDPLFPQRVNVNVAAVDARDAITLRVWERGAGLTRACGTGACATAVAAMRLGLVDRKTSVSLPGGVLAIEWADDDTIMMRGPAAISFTGSFDWGDYA
ncbi:diaminopimelate epimerase [Croceicoccus sp. F390]|uniref:Diaminopimelate epimerase n=1 Tax=Croceicoccus esteveae TaxID=3075597 RepID=A0ABU2ZJ04_9SPHN|nr:diaminopimelate epimerase [Croceicoccus sp. F390]MDT0576592.1 diaminopimelate epimerase [Croceicoccus sp. F390]